ncbi:MAG: sulfate reduction electron transfer complex DsrMKJOP subunit DsrJ [Desulfovibrionaceae bacterium]|nr:sulfate reduction electron transfer complex DsrMKJOP subunit DsrJ [Desulfovibrionaceae bacterium]
MYNVKAILTGLLVFMAIFTSPFWLNQLGVDYKRPALAMPVGEKECLAPTDYMRGEHMRLLNEWRDLALRQGERLYTDARGRTWEINLQNTCQGCHNDRAAFCDACHVSNSVSPYCWNCHLEAKGKS